MGLGRPTTMDIPVEIVDQWMHEISPPALKVLLYLLRRTWGFNKVEDETSLSQICRGITKRDGTVLDHGTGLADSTARTAIKELVAKELIWMDGGQGRVAKFRIRWAGEANPFQSQVPPNRTSPEIGEVETSPEIGEVAPPNIAGDRRSDPQTSPNAGEEHRRISAIHVTDSKDSATAAKLRPAPIGAVSSESAKKPRRIPAKLESEHLKETVAPEERQMWAVLRATLGFEPAAGTVEHTRWNAAIKDLRTNGFKADQIKEVAAAYVAAFPNARMTAMALASNALNLLRGPTPAGQGRQGRSSNGSERTTLRLATAEEACAYAEAHDGNLPAECGWHWKQDGEGVAIVRD